MGRPKKLTQEQLDVINEEATKERLNAGPPDDAVKFFESIPIEDSTESPNFEEPISTEPPDFDEPIFTEPDFEEPSGTLCTLKSDCLAVREGKSYSVTIGRVTYTFEPPDFTAVLPKDIAIKYDQTSHPIIIK
jgi:hypothetical protein